MKMSEDELNTILRNHQHWLMRDCEGWENMKANLENANLRDAYLTGANLIYANLANADLTDADLTDADLTGANLRLAILRGADFRDAHLRDANLAHAYLTGANLTYANLRLANLRDAYLTDANLAHANLIGANLVKADLRHANLVNANLIGTNLVEADLIDANLANADLTGANFGYAFLNNDDNEYRKGKMLTESIIGYKKCRGDIIVTLEIPRGAIVFSINGYKYRTNKVKVIAIDGEDRAFSNYKYMSYYVGDEITIYNFNCEYNVECGKGIHFFLDKQQAENYKE